MCYNYYLCRAHNNVADFFHRAQLQTALGCCIVFPVEISIIIIINNQTVQKNHPIILFQRRQSIVVTATKFIFLVMFA